MTESHTVRRRGLRRALGLVRRDVTAPTMCADPPSLWDNKSMAALSPRSLTNRLSSSSLSSSTSSSSSSSSSIHSPTAKLSSISRKGVTYNHDGAVVCCRFCDILRTGDADFIYQDARVAVFRPLAPVSESHVLVVPRCHIRNINALTAHDTELLTHMRDVAERVLRLDCIMSTSAPSVIDCKFAFHTPPFNSIDHVHMHAFRTQERAFGCLGAIKYRTDTWWCQSYDVVLSRVATKTPMAESFTVTNRQQAMVGISVSTN